MLRTLRKKRARRWKPKQPPLARCGAIASERPPEVERPEPLDHINEKSPVPDEESNRTLVSRCF